MNEIEFHAGVYDAAFLVKSIKGQTIYLGCRVWAFISLATTRIHNHATALMSQLLRHENFSLCEKGRKIDSVVEFSFFIKWFFMEATDTHMATTKVNLHNRVMSCRWAAKQIIHNCDFIVSKTFTPEVHRVGNLIWGFFQISPHSWYTPREAGKSNID